MPRRSSKRTRNAALTAAAIGGSGLAARSAQLLWRRRQLHWSAPERLHRSAYLECETMGSGRQPVLLLHQLGGSSQYFGAAFDELAEPGPLVVPDLLGFGSSPESSAGYSPDEHVAALCTMLDELGVQHPALVVGHGLGGVLALRMAGRHPERVTAVVAIGPPIYRNPTSARKHLTSLGPGGSARVTTWLTRDRPGVGPAARVVVGTWQRDLPRPLAGTRTLSRWTEAYRETLERCLIEADVVAWVDQITCPVQVILPARDHLLDAGLLRELSDRHQNVHLTLLPFGDRRLPLTHPDGCLAAIDRFRSAVGLASQLQGGSRQSAGPVVP